MGERAGVVAGSADLGDTGSWCVSQLGDAGAEPRDVLYWVGASQQLFERVFLLPTEAQ